MPIIVVLFLNHIGMPMPSHIATSLWINRSRRDKVTYTPYIAIVAMPATAVGIGGNRHYLARDVTDGDISDMILIG